MLMQRLNHTKYYIQGGDWGSVVGVSISRIYPEAVLGLHLNMFPVVGLRATLGTPGMLLDYSDEYEWSKLFPLSGYLQQIVYQTGSSPPLLYCC